MTIKEITLPSQSPRQAQVRFFYSSSKPFIRPVADHFHVEYEIHVIENGTGTYLIGDREIPFGPHDIFLFRSNEQHFVSSRGPGEEEVDETGSYGIYFSPDLIQYLDSGIFDTKYMRLFSGQNSQFIHHIPAGTELGRELFSCTELIRREFVGEKPGYEMVIMASLIRFIAGYTRSYTAEALNSISTEKNIIRVYQDGLKKALEYIDMHLTEDLTIEKIASVANMSASFYFKIFKQAYGYTTWDYIISKRMLLASRYLRESDESVTDIVCKCGFNSYANFNRHFKRFYGQTPYDFRKSNNGD